VSSEGSFRWLAGVCATGVLAGGLYLRFDYDLPLPRRPPKPKPTDVAAAFRALDYDPNVYRAAVEKDAADAGLKPPSLEELGQFLPYDVVEPARAVHPGGPPITSRDLAVSMRSARLPISLPNGTFVTMHAILRVENRTDGFVAYHVDTRPSVNPRLCFEKADLPHNAIALAPRETIERTECGRDIEGVTVERIETLAIPALSYRYVSLLYPSHIGLDPRPTRGHQPKTGSICNDIPEQAIRLAMEKGKVSWRDVIDFYARHSCKRFIFPEGYQAFTRSQERPLPVTPAAAASRP